MVVTRSNNGAKQQSGPAPQAPKPEQAKNQGGASKKQKWKPERADGRVLKAHRAKKKIEPLHKPITAKAIESVWPKGMENHQPRSFNNTGNICHANAVVQALLHLPPFVSFLNLGHDRCKKDKECVLCALIQMAFRYWGTEVEKKTPTHGGFEYALDNFRTAFEQQYIALGHDDKEKTARRAAVGVQQDAGETQRNLLEAIESEVPRTSSEDGQDPTPNYITGLIDDLFKVELMVETRCTSCQRRHRRPPIYDRCWTLPTSESAGEKTIGTVEEGAKERTTLVQHIERALGAKLNQDIACDSEGDCENRKAVEEKTMLTRLPRILTIILQRGQEQEEQGQNGMVKNLVKDRRVVEYPDELDLSQFMADGSSWHYRLRAVVSHVGTREGGHYFAVVREQNGRIAGCNDSSISRFARVREHDKLFSPKKQSGGLSTSTGDAYLIYYVREVSKKK